MQELRITAREHNGDRVHVNPVRLKLAMDLVEALSELLRPQAWIRIGRFQLTYREFTGGITTLAWDMRYHPEVWGTKYVPIGGMHDLPAGSMVPLRADPPSANDIALAIAQSMAGQLDDAAARAGNNQEELDAEGALVREGILDAATEAAADAKEHPDDS